MEIFTLTSISLIDFILVFLSLIFEAIESKTGCKVTNVSSTIMLLIKLSLNFIFPDPLLVVDFIFSFFWFSSAGFIQWLYWMNYQQMYQPGPILSDNPIAKSLKRVEKSHPKHQILETLRTTKNHIKKVIKWSNLRIRSNTWRVFPKN